MKTSIQYTFTFLTIVILSGCSINNAYYGTQQYQVNQCLETMPSAEYDDCIKQLGKSYEEYSQQRKEIIAPE